MQDRVDDLYGRRLVTRNVRLTTLAVITGIGVLAAILSFRRSREKNGGLRSTVRRLLRMLQGSLVTTSVMLPGTAAAVTTAIYLQRTYPKGGLGGRPGLNVFLLGSEIALAVWALVAIAFCRLASADRANTSVYGLQRELLDRLSSATYDPAQSASVMGQIASNDIGLHLAAVRRELGLVVEDRDSSVGVQWVLSTGYTSVWRRLHRIEEALYHLRPIEGIIEQAVQDDLRIRNSTMREHDELLRSLAQAVYALRPTAAQYLPIRGVGSQVLQGGSPEDARGILLGIRATINDFRDDGRDGLIRAKNNLAKAVILTGGTAYLLLGVALIAGATYESVLAAAVFYLVGAAVGLFRQLSAASSVKTVQEEDYGLSMARLIHTPLFSGVAAVGGVVVIGILGSVIPSPPPAHTGPLMTSLSDIFSLSQNFFGLVAAAAFGLTPTALISRLQAQAEQFKTDLSSSDPSGGH